MRRQWVASSAWRCWVSAGVPAIMLVIVGVFHTRRLCGMRRRRRDLLIRLEGRLNHSFRPIRRGESSGKGVFDVEAFTKALVKA